MCRLDSRMFGAEPGDPRSILTRDAIVCYTLLFAINIANM